MENMVEEERERKKSCSNISRQDNTKTTRAVYEYLGPRNRHIWTKLCPYNKTVESLVL